MSISKNTQFRVLARQMAKVLNEEEIRFISGGKANGKKTIYGSKPTPSGTPGPVADTDSDELDIRYPLDVCVD